MHLQQTNSLLTITGEQLIKAYAKMGIDIRRLIPADQRISLFEDEETGLLRYTPSIPGDEVFYQQLSRQPWYYQEDKEEFRIAIRELKQIRAKRVLEIGCGHGAFGWCLKNELPATEYVGIELNSMAADHARSRSLNIIQEDFFGYACNHKGSFDAICSFQVLEHLPDPWRYYQAANTALQRKGISICSVPSEDSFISAEPFTALNAPPHHLTRWTDRALKKLPKKHGFELLLLAHLPVERIHARWFFSTLISSQLQRDNRPQTSFFRHHLIRRFLTKALPYLLAGAEIENRFGIPGHTAIAIHRKVASS